MKYQLVLQWSASSREDHDAVIAMSDDLTVALRENADVDGWDFGSGEMNIFIYCDDPQRAFNQAKVALEDHARLSSARAAYRDVEGDTFTVIWPDGLDRFEVA